MSEFSESKFREVSVLEQFHEVLHIAEFTVENEFTYPMRIMKAETVELLAKCTSPKHIEHHFSS